MGQQTCKAESNEGLADVARAINQLDNANRVLRDFGYEVADITIVPSAGYLEAEGAIIERAVHRRNRTLASNAKRRH